MTELPTSLIVLEYIKTFLSWPVVVGALSVLFMWRFQASITTLIGRITGIAFPGGKVDAPQYKPENTTEFKALDTEVSETSAQPSIISEHVEKRVDELEKDFDAFYIQQLLTNAVIINNLLDIIWIKAGKAIFNKKHRPDSIQETVKQLGDSIDPRVASDAGTIQSNIKDYFATRKVDRKGFLKAIKTSELIIDYFRRIVTAK